MEELKNYVDRAHGRANIILNNAPIKINTQKWEKRNYIDVLEDSFGDGKYSNYLDCGDGFMTLNTWLLKLFF